MNIRTITSLKKPLDFAAYNFVLPVTRNIADFGGINNSYCIWPPKKMLSKVLCEVS